MEDDDESFIYTLQKTNDTWDMEIVCCFCQLSLPKALGVMKAVFMKAGF